MDNSQLGLVVNQITPNNNETVGITSKIKITFNKALNTSTVTNNVLILRDKNYIYNSNGEIIVNKEDIVNCNLSYSNTDFSLLFTPKSLLINSCKYVIYINGLKDVEGNAIKNQLFTFYTNSKEVKLVDITSPADNAIFPVIPDIKFKPIEGDLSYLLQISKNKDFNIININKIVEVKNYEECLISLNTKLDDGLYYYRIKAFSNDFCEPKTFYIKTAAKDELKTNEEDEKEFIDEDLLNDNSVFVLDKNFKDDNLNIATNTNLISFTLNGKYTIDDIDIFESFIEYEPFIEDKDDTNREYEPNGTWYTVYDEHKDITTVIFILDKIPIDKAVEES